MRETDKSLVFEVAFDSVHASKRHKSGLAMRLPRIHRIRWDKPAHEADRIEALLALVRIENSVPPAGARLSFYSPELCSKRRVGFASGL